MYEKPELVLVSDVGSVVLGVGGDDWDGLIEEEPVAGITCGLDD